MSDQKYYFWLVCWGYEKINYPLFTTYILFEVGQNGFTIYDSKKPIHIRWDQVYKINSYQSASPMGHAMEIFLTVNARSQKMYLIATNIMNSTNLHHVQEHDALFSVMNTLRSDGSITIHPNPYYRAFERAGKPDYFFLQNWDPTVSPKEYRKHPAIQNAILRSQKRGFLWVYWITTVFVTFASFLILFQGGKHELDAVAFLASMWLFVTIVFSWFISSANRDLSK